MALAEYLIAISPWYLLPLAWAFAGTAFTGVSRCTHSADLAHGLDWAVLPGLIKKPGVVLTSLWTGVGSLLLLVP